MTIHQNIRFWRICMVLNLTGMFFHGVGFLFLDFEWQHGLAAGLFFLVACHCHRQVLNLHDRPTDYWTDKE